MESNYRRRLIAISTFLGGIYFFLIFILPEQALKALQVADIQADISLGFVAIGLVTFGLGIINLFMIHGSKIIYLKKGWIPSAALLGGLFLMLAFSIYDWVADARVQKHSDDIGSLVEFSRAIAADAGAERQDVPPAAIRIEHLYAAAKKTIVANKESLKNLPQLRSEADLEKYKKLAQVFDQALSKVDLDAEQIKGSSNTAEVVAFGVHLADLAASKRDMLSVLTTSSLGKKMYQLLFHGLFVSLGSALFSLLGVYIAAAAYRAFRIKTFESSLMMISALLVMLGQISFGSWLYSGMPEIRAWLLEIPNSAASRAISIGASVAGLVLAFRMWFSIETSSFSKGKGK